MIAGVGTNDTRHTMELARAAEKAGAHGLLVVTPYYNRPPQAGLLQHFRRWPTPRPAGDGLRHPRPRRVPIETDTLVRLAEHERIVAVKDAKGDLGRDVLGDARTDLAYYSGDDKLTLPLLAVGAVGVVGTSTHLFGPETKQMITATSPATWRRARPAPPLLPLFTGFFRTQGVILIKAALNLLGSAGRPGAPAAGGRERRPRSPRCARTAAAGRTSAAAAATRRSRTMSQRAPRDCDGRRRRCRPAALRIIPLGGLGAIGRNMTVFEFDGRLLVVDCGVLFPDVEQPGVDLILPDFTSILDRLDDVEAIVLTHGHEDHIGAVPYLLAHKPDIPLVGSQFTLALVEAKLAERRIQPYALTVTEGAIERLGPFECEFFAVNHSIPDALAVAITTPAGTVLHTGDFKMDQLPLDGRLTDLAGFARLGARASTCCCPTRPTPRSPASSRPSGRSARCWTASSRRPAAGSSSPRSPPTCTGSSRCSTRRTRTAARSRFIGRSMVRNMGIARDLGLLRIPAGLVVGIDEATSLPPEQIVLMSTGSQGEPMSALGRMATGDHRHIAIEQGDTVVLASSLVPGNETAVYRVINRLSRAGAFVVHKDVAKVHVSGHSPAGELLYLLNVVKPRNFMPVHGEWRHLRAHAQLAIESGVARDRVVLCEDGDVVDLVDGRARLVGHMRHAATSTSTGWPSVTSGVAADRAAHPGRRRVHRGDRGDRFGHRQGGGRPDRLGEGLLRGPGGVRCGGAADHGCA